MPYGSPINYLVRRQTNLVTATKPIHEGKHDVFYRKIYQHIHIWQRELIFKASSVQVPKVRTSPDLLIPFPNW